MTEQPNLQAMLDDYRCGKGKLPTYDELVMIDIQIGSQQAQIAALRHAIRTILTEQAAIGRAYMMYGGNHDAGT